jgi:acyl CoA:acetate/3-ketoacid CoA transferase beta subunit
MDITPDEIMAYCMANQVTDGQIVAQGIATPLVAAAYVLARRTHAPNLYFMSAIGQGICRQPAPLGLTRIESLWLDCSIKSLGFVQAAADVLPCLRPLEFFRPGQVDPAGNFNNIAFGTNYRRPRLRLPGTGGIPDVTTFLEDIYLYVPRHSRVTFVKELDYLSGLGHHPARSHGSGARYLVTNLGQFDFNGIKHGQNRMRLLTYHPGVSIERIQARTGFELEIDENVHATPMPSEEELRLLREQIDPLNIRRLELLSGAARRSLLHEIIHNESSQFE